MSRRESYKAPLQRSKFMIDFWIGIYQLKQVFVQKTKLHEGDTDILIPRFFLPTQSEGESGSSYERGIDDVDLYDIERSLANIKNLRDVILLEAHENLLSAVQLQQSLRGAVKANLMVSRVTGYVKKKKFSTFLKKSNGAAHLTTDMKLVPDVTSLEYRVCHAVLYMLQKDFEEVVEQITQKIQRTMDHIKSMLCAALIELDPDLTPQSIDESGLFLWSNPAFLTDWVSFVTALHRKDDEVSDASQVKDAKKKSVFKKIRKSVAGSLSPTKKSAIGRDDALVVLIKRVSSLAPLHAAYLETSGQLLTPSSSIYFKSLLESKLDSRPRVLTNISDSSTDSNQPKWYFGKFAGRKSPAERRRSISASSVGSDDLDENSQFDDALSEYAELYAHVFVGEDENAAVEIDHRMIHAVVNEVPPGESDMYTLGPDHNTDVRLFSWYMYVVMHNTRCIGEKLTRIAATHAKLKVSADKETDKECLQEYVKVGKVLMDNVVSTTQIIRSLRDLFTEDSDEIDDTSSRHTIQNFCLYVTHQWLKESQRVNKAVSRFIEMRRENVAIMIKSAMPICSEDEVEAIVTHDDGMHVHKLITAVSNGRSEVARLLEARLKGPHSSIYSDMELFRNQASQVVESLTAILDQPLKHLKC